MTVTVKHSKTNSITDWTQAQLDEQITLGNFPSGTTLANIVLPSDWNNDHTLTGVGTMAEQDADTVAITGGTATLSSVTTPSVTATTNNLTLNAISTGKINLNTATANQVQITDATAANGQYTLLSRDNTANEQRISGATATGGVNFGISSAVAGSVKFYTNGFTELQAQVARTASAVNYVQVTGAATGGFPSLTAQGSDTNVGLYYTTKGFGSHRFTGNGGGGSEQFRITTNSASTVNFFQVVGSATTLAPQFSAQGTDTNISMAFQSKGTGAIDLAAGSSGVNISNGGTVTAITRTSSGSGYTSIPSVAVSAPTTAGGVTSTVSVAQMQIAGATIAGGGTGYTVGNTLTIVGGTPVSGAATLTVTTVSAGVITGVSIAAFNNYTALPTNPVSVTGGSGSGATFNLTWAVISFTITNAGSGYIEQPTITFSGGGGSGAAAYASIGNTTTVKGLYGGNSQIAIQFSTAAGGVLKLMDGGTTATPTSLIIKSGNGGTQLYPDTANSQTYISSSGAGFISFQTNTLAAEQFRIIHTASAVNYVQVTGGATTVRPLISVQGSDTNIGMTYGAKGTGIHAFTNGNGTQLVLQAGATSSVNRIEITPTVTGAAPIIAAGGTDTNIDLALTPKGTGRLRFGTYTATVSTIAGYIEILDSGGTVRRLAVVS